MDSHSFGAFRVRLTGPRSDGSFALHRNNDNEAFAFISRETESIWNWWDASGRSGSAPSQHDCVAMAFHANEPGTAPTPRTP